MAILNTSYGLNAIYKTKLFRANNALGEGFVDTLLISFHFLFCLNTARQRTEFTH
jgi:hypothetical protein